MDDEELKKILFTLYMLRNSAATVELRQYAQESIGYIESHFGITEDEE